MKIRILVVLQNNQLVNSLLNIYSFGKDPIVGKKDTQDLVWCYSLLNC